MKPKKWIKFDETISFVNKKNQYVEYIANVKYRIDSEDYRYYYVGDMVISRNRKDFETGEILEP